MTLQVVASPAARTITTFSLATSLMRFSRFPGHHIAILAIDGAARLRSPQVRLYSSSGSSKNLPGSERQAAKTTHHIIETPVYSLDGNKNRITTGTTALVLAADQMYRQRIFATDLLMEKLRDCKVDAPHATWVNLKVICPDICNRQLDLKTIVDITKKLQGYRKDVYEPHIFKKHDLNPQQLWLRGFNIEQLGFELYQQLLESEDLAEVDRRDRQQNRGSFGGIPALEMLAEGLIATEMVKGYQLDGGYAHPEVQVKASSKVTKYSTLWTSFTKDVEKILSGNLEGSALLDTMLYGSLFPSSKKLWLPALLNSAKCFISVQTKIEFEFSFIAKPEVEENRRNLLGIDILDANLVSLEHAQLRQEILWDLHDGIVADRGRFEWPSRSFRGHTDLMIAVTAHLARMPMVTSDRKFLRTYESAFRKHGIKVIYVPNWFWQTGPKAKAWSVEGAKANHEAVTEQMERMKKQWEL